MWVEASSGVCEPDKQDFYVFRVAVHVPLIKTAATVLEGETLTVEPFARLVLEHQIDEGRQDNQTRLRFRRLSSTHSICSHRAPGIQYNGGGLKGERE